MALRWRIAGLVAAAICAAAAVVGVLVHRASHERELSQARTAALTTLDRAAVSYSRTGTVSGTGATLGAHGVPAGLRGLVRQGHRGTQYTSGPGGPAMWAARPAGRGTLAVRLPMGTTMRDLGALDTSIILAGLLTTALVLPLGVLTARRMSRRLRTAAGTARMIAAGDLDARIAARARPYDEIAEISGAVDSMAASLQARLRSEQRFTSDVAHELRTPLMGLVTAAELLPEGEAEGYVRDRVRVLSILIEDLLEVSRLDAGVERADLSHCALGPLLEEVADRTGLAVSLRVAGEPVPDGERASDGGPASVREPVSDRGPVSDRAPVSGGGPVSDGEPASEGGVAGAGEVRAWTDPRRLERIVSNLIVNAHRHGLPPVTVSVMAGADGKAVTVRDHGSGFPAHLLREGPQRFRTGARERGRGQGLGLTIALGQAQVIGATLEFANLSRGEGDDGDGGGALATLRLPEGLSPERIPD